MMDEDNAIAEIDLDLEAAVVHRRAMFRKFLARDAQRDDRGREDGDVVSTELVVILVVVLIVVLLVRGSW